MNILLISGSPRKNGNTTAIMRQLAEKLSAKHHVGSAAFRTTKSTAVWAAITVKAFWTNPDVCSTMM